MHARHENEKYMHVHVTFTFTFICPLGKTHNHRSRGDTPWRAQTDYCISSYMHLHSMREDNGTQSIA